MGGSNPVVLVGLLTAISLVITIFKWHDAPAKVPIWWDLHGEYDFLFVCLFVCSLLYEYVLVV